MIQDAASEYYDPKIYNKEIKRRSTPKFRKQIRQEVYDQANDFIDGFIVDDVDNANNSDTSDTSDTDDDDSEDTTE
jgi:hypothetical protein